jgi:hypothetical protein
MGDDSLEGLKAQGDRVIFSCREIAEAFRGRWSLVKEVPGFCLAALVIDEDGEHHAVIYEDDRWGELVLREKFLCHFYVSDDADDDQIAAAFKEEIEKRNRRSR